MRPISLALALAISLGVAAAQAQEPERVVMKLEEFLKLYEKAKAEKPEEPPRDHAIAAARYRGEVLFEDGKPYAARFRTTMKVRPLRGRGFARIPLLPANVALESALIDGKEAPVVLEGGFYQLITDRRADFDLELIFGAAVTTAEGSSAVTFQLVPAGATGLELSVPSSEELDFVVANAKLKSDRVVGNARVVEASIPASGALSISWQRRIEATAKKQARVYSEVYTLTSLGDGVVRATSRVESTILFAGVERFRYQLPSGMTVLEVKGPGVRSWKVEADQLEVLLNFAAEGAYAMNVVMERPLAVGAVSVPAPILAPLEVERARGWVGVESRGNLELSAEKVANATPVDVRGLPASILGVTDQPVLLGYKYLGASPSISLRTAQHAEAEVLVTLVDQTDAHTLWTREGRRLTSVKYQIRNNRRQFLKLGLPPGAELWSASVANRAAQPARAKDGHVMIPLIRSQRTGNTLAAFVVEVVYVENGAGTDRRGRGTFQARLPVPDAPSTYVAWTIHSPEGSKVRRRTVDGTLERVKQLAYPIPPPPAAPSYVEVAAQQQLPAAQAIVTDADGLEDLKGGELAQAAPPPAPLARGADPVLVSLPLQGVETYFEKTLALGEPLEVTFSYRGLRKRR